MISEKAGLEETMFGRLPKLRMIIHVRKFQILKSVKDTKTIENDDFSQVLHTGMSAQLRAL